jgi:hypothetical protein
MILVMILVLTLTLVLVLPYDMTTSKSLNLFLNDMREEKRFQIIEWLQCTTFDDDDDNDDDEY